MSNSAQQTEVATADTELSGDALEALAVLLCDWAERDESEESIQQEVTE